jgi:acetyl esterase/lipase
MVTIKLVILILVILAASVVLLLGGFALFRLRQPTSLMSWMIKVFASAFSPIFFLAAIIFAVSGLLLNSMPVMVIGIISTLLYLFHIIKITRAPDTFTGFESQYGSQWKHTIPVQIKDHFLKKRYVVRLPASHDPIVLQNIPFYTIRSTNRRLLCDLWQPPAHVKPSGLAFIYLHGSAWVVLDKDYGTRTFFKHLAQQGHVIMDVAYRLFPETDMMGMVHDAKHAIAWMKTNAAVYNVNPHCILIGGGSAGGHIALLAAYTDVDKQFMPADLENSDTSVKGVVSLYGVADLVNTYYHTCQHITTHSAISKKKMGSDSGMPAPVKKIMGKDFHRLGFDKDEEPGMLVPILGGNPDEKPEQYALFSPITHVHKGCPATLLIQGEHDILSPVTANRLLFARLKKFTVPVVMHILPQTDHAFDLLFPKISPSAHNVFFDI